jgi:O-antigen/teichoic acid export membrane protein
VSGFVIAVVAGLLPFVLGSLGLGRARVILGVGGIVAFGWLIALAADRPTEPRAVPLWFVAGLVLLLYAIWCVGLWLGVRFRRMRRAAPG